ncbi:hypothetical protein [Streptomyces sp. NPDC001250]
MDQTADDGLIVAPLPIAAVPNMEVNRNTAKVGRSGSNPQVSGL